MSMCCEACEGLFVYYLHQLCLHAEYVTCKSRGLEGQSVNSLQTKTAWIRELAWVSYLLCVSRLKKLVSPWRTLPYQCLNYDGGCPTVCEQDPDMDELLQIEMLELEPWGGIFQIELNMSNVRDALKEAFLKQGILKLDI